MAGGRGGKIPLVGSIKEIVQRVGRRLDEWHSRYARIFWTLHSVWALISGAGVLVLAHNRYGYLPWVVAFLGLTWASTLFFTRAFAAVQSKAMRYAQEFVSYLTRVMYQGTLFFLLPFYSYSVTFWSANTLFVVLLAVLAVLSCFDLLFDRLLRRYRLFALSFFALVTFAALNFFFPLIFGTRLHHGTYLAVGLAVGAALPLAFSFRELLRPRLALRAALVLLVALLTVRAARPLIPPVPLRLAKVRFAAALDPTTLATPREWAEAVPAAELNTGKLFVIATIYSPTRVPTTVTIKVLRAGVVLRTSRVVELLAHERGFRVWDRVPLELLAGASPTRQAQGPLVVEVWTAEGHLLGRVKAQIQ